MKLSTRLTTALVAVALLAVSAVALVVDRGVEATILPRELARERVSTASLITPLGLTVSSAKADILSLRGSTAVEGILGARLSERREARGKVTQTDERARLASLFEAELMARPAYDQLRLIGASDSGKEILRVDRSGLGGSVRTVPENELQQKGDRDYFGRALSLQPGQFYVSPIELNQEHGRVEVPHRPVIRVATRIDGPDGQAAGILIVNVDLRSSLDRLRAAAGAGESIFLINQSGDYLLHPQPSKEFGFDLGERFQIQQDLPGVLDSLDWDEASSTEALDVTGRRVHVITAPLRLAHGLRVALIRTIPDEAMLATLAPVRRSALMAGLAVAVVAAAVALLLTRSLTRPLERITAAVEAFRLDEPTSVPTHYGGEIGVLARAFERMAVEVREKRQSLKREIEQRRHAEEDRERHARRERLFAAVIQSSVDAVVTQDLEGAITGWNPAAERLYGYSAEEAIGKSFELITPVDRREEIGKILKSVGTGEFVATFETLRVNKEGRFVEVSLTVSPVKSPSGDIVGISSISRDISARKKEAEKFRIAVESSPSGMVMTDAEGTIVMVNAETERLFGYDRLELIGQTLEILIPDRFRVRHSSHRALFLQSPQVRAMGVGRDLFGLRKDGSEFPVEIGLNPIDTKDGLRVLSAIVDITERKAAEAALAEQTRELKRSNAELEQFAYVASHDLQEPLRMVASYTELLGDRYRGQLDDRADKYLEYVVDGAHRMQRMINDLLAYSRVGTQAGELQPIDSEKVFSLVVRQMRERIEASRAEVVAGPLPTVVADEVQLGQVFQNLIGNAIKFQAEQPPRVRVEAEKLDGFWRFSVSDNGIGIDKQHAGRLFQMFQRLHERGKYEGNGIGLAITRRIVERHGGSVWFDSALGKGATFYFTIPC